MTVKERAQSLVELALVLPMILLVLLVCFQFGILFITQMSVMNAARDAGRWVAVHPNYVDNTTCDQIKGRLPSNLIATKLQIAINPPCSVVNADDKCTGRDVGTQLTTTLSYNASSLVFLPAQFGLGGAVGKVPIAQSLPAYTVWTMAERPQARNSDLGILPAPANRCDFNN